MKRILIQFRFDDDNSIAVGIKIMILFEIDAGEGDQTAVFTWIVLAATKRVTV